MNVLDMASGQSGELGCIGYDVAQTLNRNNGGFHYVACFERSGGGIMNVEKEELSPTLRREMKGHEPVICSTENVGEKCPSCGEIVDKCRQENGIVNLYCDHCGWNGETCSWMCAGFMGGQGAKAGGLGYSEETSPTLKSALSGGNTVPDVVCVHGSQDPVSNSEHANAVNCNRGLENCVLQKEDVVCYENHGQDCRIKELAKGVFSQLNAKAVTGGNNLPIVQTFQKVSRAHAKDGDGERWDKSDVAATQNVFDCGDTRAVDVCVPINSMIIGKELKDGDRQTVGIGNNGDPSPTLQSEHHHAVACIALDGDKIGKAERKGGSGFGVNEDGSMYTQTAKDVHAVATNATVRRLMPVECERLMGFPDNWTRISWKGKPEEECPDSPRYKACGNSMCVNVMRWIGMRIQMVEDGKL